MISIIFICCRIIETYKELINQHGSIDCNGSSCVFWENALLDAGCSRGGQQLGKALNTHCENVNQERKSVEKMIWKNTRQKLVGKKITIFVHHSVIFSDFSWFFKTNLLFIQSSSSSTFQSSFPPQSIIHFPLYWTLKQQNNKQTNLNKIHITRTPE